MSYSLIRNITGPKCLNLKFNRALSQPTTARHCTRYITLPSCLWKERRICVGRRCANYRRQYNTLQHNATDCNRLQHTASRCTCVGRAMWELKATTQHTATRCNTLHLCENSDAGTIGACVSNMQQPPTTTVSCHVHIRASFHVSISCPFMSARSFKTHLYT